MLLQAFRAKIHRVKVTGAELNYIGSITLDKALIEASGILVGEKVQIVNIDNGERFETYVIEGERNSGDVILNGPAARRVQKGDTIIVIAYGYMTPEEAKAYQPKIIFPNEETNLLT